MNNFEGYITNIIFGIILLLGYNFCGIIPTILGFLTWFLINRILGDRFAEEQKASIISAAAGIGVAVIAALIMRLILRS
ncbi:MAG: hypothetical protein IJG52_04495 [Lachnospiraceae bacterium]|nr:hypothetical protein [Lachnospiraceae bacterium]